MLFQFRVSTFHYPPVVSLDTSSANAEKPQHEGLEVKIIETIGEALNIRMGLEVPRDGDRWGYQRPDGTFTGVVR